MPSPPGPPMTSGNMRELGVPSRSNSSTMHPEHCSNALTIS